MKTHPTTTQLYGSVHLIDQTYTDLALSGSGHLTKVTVTHSALFRGSAYLADFRCPELTVKGSLHGDGLEVIQATIFGSCHCDNSLFDVMAIYGSCSVNTVKIATQLFIQGSCIASRVECPMLEASTTYLEFKKSSITTIVIKKSENSYKGIFNLWGLFDWGTNSAQPTEVYLDDSSVESIIFQDEPGLVVLTHGATVGHVVNGTIEKR